MEVDEPQQTDSSILSFLAPSNRPRDRHLRAVIDTITDEINRHGLPLTPVSYFAAASSSLLRLSPQDPALEPLLAFLSAVLPAVPVAVVRSKAVEVGEMLKGVLEMEAGSDGVARAAVKCLSRLLMGGEKGKWEEIEDMFRFFLGFVTEKRDKVRIQAHSCLRDVLQSFEGTPVLLPASEVIVHILSEFLSLAGGSSSSDVQGSRGVWEVLFILNALKESLTAVSNKSRSKILKFLKPLLVLRQPIVTKAIVEILHTLCSNISVEVPPEILVDILCFLASSDFSREKSADAMASIARLLHVGIKKVCACNMSIGAGKLPMLFSTLEDTLACGHEEAMFASMEAFKGLISTCIEQSMIDQGIEQISQAQSGVRTNVAPSSIKKICATMEGLLGYKYMEVMDMSFQIVSAMFDRLGVSSSYFMVGVIKNLANLEKLSDDDLAYRKQLHECVGSAISALGPEMFLKILPLNLESEDSSDANVWLLPILKQYIVGAKLSFFKQSILVMVHQMQQRSQKLEREGLIVSARSAQGIVHSLWSLLPAFCNYPSDTATSFGDLIKELCDTLRKEPDLRGLICSSLQILVRQNKEILEENGGTLDELSLHEQKAKDGYTPQLAKENLDSIRSSTKAGLRNSRTTKRGDCTHNIILVLFEIFLNSSESGGCVQATIRELASISEKKDVKIMFKNVMLQLKHATTKALVSTEDSDMQVDSPQDDSLLSMERGKLLDLAASLLPGLGSEEIEFLLENIDIAIGEENSVFQKKAYKALSILLKEHIDCLLDLDKVLKRLVDVLPSCCPSSKRHRLDSLYFIMIHVAKNPSAQQKQDVIISSFLTEIILALKESNKKIRNTAYDLLVKLGHAHVGEDNKEENSLQQFFVTVGYHLNEKEDRTGKERANMISAVIKGLARLTYEFSDLIGSAYSLLPLAFLYLKEKNREICKANLGLVKVVIAKSHVDRLHVHLKSIVDGLVKWEDNTKNHFKAKVKLLLEMLVHKCGLEAVKEAMPEEHMKLLTNIRKITSRKKRKAKSEEDGKSLHSKTSSRHSRWNHTAIFSDAADEDWEGSDADQVVSRTGSLGRASSLRSKKSWQPSKSLPGDLLDWLETDPLDLLDRQKTRAVIKCSPQNKRKLDSDDELEIDSDGRLVIHDSGRKAKKEKRHYSDSEADTKSHANSHLSARSLPKSQSKRQKVDSGWAYTGNEYKSKKASGDVKRKNKLEPYAYWPLDRKLLNRREENKAMARKGMASVIKMTKKLEGKSAASALSVKGPKMYKKQVRKTKKHKP